jgi:hypothetical protein
MWMLIRQLTADEIASPRRAQVTHLRPVAPHASKSRSLLSASSMLAVLSAARAGVNAAEAGPVSVLLHPGRSQLAHVTVERVFDQFECSDRAVYASVAEAETRHAGDVGFLLKIDCPFTDLDGTKRERGVVFARSVRD